VRAAREILRLWGVVIKEERVRRRIYLRLDVQNTNWEAARMGEVVDMGLLPSPLWQFLQAALRSGEYRYRDLEIGTGSARYIGSLAELRERLRRIPMRERASNRACRRLKRRTMEVPRWV
jgi:hypothetical protein